MVEATLPAQFHVHPPTPHDADAIVKLLTLYENTVEYIGFTPKDLYTSWQEVEFNVETDAWVIETETCEIVGYAFVRGHHAPISIVCEDLAYSGQGIWPYLLQKVEERVHEFMITDKLYVGITLSTAFNDTFKEAMQTVEQRGYELVHTAWRMEIELAHEPEQPQLPDNITLRAFIRGHDEHTAHELSQEAFQLIEPFAEWELKFADESFDPSLWFFAEAAGKVVGGAFCYNYPDGGWVWDLAVLDAWRHKGIGLALLQHAFAEFYRRGKYKVGLDVNAENPTGATRLYHRAGMHIAQKYYIYHKHIPLEKEVR